MYAYQEQHLILGVLEYDYSTHKIQWGSSIVQYIGITGIWVQILTMPLTSYVMDELTSLSLASSFSE